MYQKIIVINFEATPPYFRPGDELSGGVVEEVLDVLPVAQSDIDSAVEDLEAAKNRAESVIQEIDAAIEKLGEE